MASIIYETDTDNVTEILKLHHQGEKILCPVCGSELTILDSWETASAYQRYPGIYCSVIEDHVYVTFLLSDRHDEVWRRVEERMKIKTND